mgnify:CR=1 FL=1
MSEESSKPELKQRKGAVAAEEKAQEEAVKEKVQA